MTPDKHSPIPVTQSDWREFMREMSSVSKIIESREKAHGEMMDRMTRMEEREQSGREERIKMMPLMDNTTKALTQLDETLNAVRDLFIETRSAVSYHGEILKWGGGIMALIIAGLLVWFFTTE